ncbi:hypothetical protein [Aerococcus viridans]|uniref:hypothetical protein n=1 Tax=Aerococcus viridans TaxID=1377 RepID=UPI002DBC5D30|nr:hypothetical protein [Aerococcus viridans]MEC1387349.1 hypothetical protein [Aerococcus viridans]
MKNKIRNLMMALGVGVAIIAFWGEDIVEAATNFTCGTNCIGITHTTGESVVLSNQSITVPEGGRILLEGTTTTSSRFNTEYHLVKGYYNYGSVVATWGGGNNWKHFTNLPSGVYRVKAVCKDTSSQNRCGGRATIQRY